MKRTVEELVRQTRCSRQLFVLEEKEPALGEAAQEDCGGQLPVSRAPDSMRNSLKGIRWGAHDLLLWPVHTHRVYTRHHTHKHLKQKEEGKGKRKARKGPHYHCPFTQQVARWDYLMPGTFIAKGDTAVQRQCEYPHRMFILGRRETRNQQSRMSDISGTVKQ